MENCVFCIKKRKNKESDCGIRWVKSKKNRMFLGYHKQIRYYLIRNYYSRKGGYTEGEREQ